MAYFSGKANFGWKPGVGGAKLYPERDFLRSHSPTKAEIEDEDELEDDYDWGTLARPRELDQENNLASPPLVCSGCGSGSATGAPGEWMPPLGGK